MKTKKEERSSYQWLTHQQEEFPSLGSEPKATAAMVSRALHRRCIPSPRFKTPVAPGAQELRIWVTVLGIGGCLGLTCSCSAAFEPHDHVTAY